MRTRSRTPPGRGRARATHGYAPKKHELTKRLSRIEGQVRGIAKMVDEDRYCIYVLQQVSAVRAALDKLALGLLDEHVQHCTLAGAGDDERRDETSSELMVAVSRFARS